MTGVDGESDQVRDTVRDLKAIAGAIGNLDRKIEGVSLSIHQAVQEFKKIIDDDGRRTAILAPMGRSDRSWFHGGNNRYGDSDSLIAKFERNLPEFDGFWHIDDLTSWIEAIEDFFEEISPSEHLKCKIVWCKMKGAAYYWWKQLQRDRIKCGKEEITSWPRMKKLLFNKFSPPKCSTNVPSELYSSKWEQDAVKESILLNSVDVCEGESEVEQDLGVEIEYDMVEELRGQVLSAKLPNIIEHEVHEVQGAKSSTNNMKEGVLQGRSDLKFMGPEHIATVTSKRQLRIDTTALHHLYKVPILNLSFHNLFAVKLSFMFHPGGNPFNKGLTNDWEERNTVKHLSIIDQPEFEAILHVLNRVPVLDNSERCIPEYYSLVEGHEDEVIEGNTSVQLPLPAGQTKQVFLPEKGDSYVIGGPKEEVVNDQLPWITVNQLNSVLKVEMSAFYGHESGQKERSQFPIGGHMLPPLFQSLKLLYEEWDNIGLSILSHSHEFIGAIMMNFDPGGLCQNKLTMDDGQGQGIAWIGTNLYFGDIVIHKGKGMNGMDLVTWISDKCRCLRNDFVKVGTVRNGTTRFWMLHSRFERYIKVVMFLFDPGGTFYITSTWVFRNYLFSCSNFLAVSDTMIFTIHSDNVLVRVVVELLLELLMDPIGDPYVEKDDFPIVLSYWQSQNVLVTVVLSKGYAEQVTVMGITEIHGIDHLYELVIVHRNLSHYVLALFDGDVLISDYLAILLFLEEKYPEKGLLPSDQHFRALYLQATSIAHSSIEHIRHMMGILASMEDNLSSEGSSKCAVNSTEKRLYALVKMLNKCAGKYATGQEVSFSVDQTGTSFNCLDIYLPTITTIIHCKCIVNLKDMDSFSIQIAFGIHLVPILNLHFLIVVTVVKKRSGMWYSLSLHVADLLFLTHLILEFLSMVMFLQEFVETINGNGNRGVAYKEGQLVSVQPSNFQLGDCFDFMNEIHYTTWVGRHQTWKRHTCGEATSTFRGVRHKMDLDGIIWHPIQRRGYLPFELLKILRGCLYDVVLRVAKMLMIIFHPEGTIPSLLAGLAYSERFLNLRPPSLKDKHIRGIHADKNNSNTKGKFIMIQLYVTAILSCLSKLCVDGTVMMALKLFHDVVNGLDPPMDIDDVCWVFQWIGSCPGLSMLRTLVFTRILTNQHLIKFNSRTSLFLWSGMEMMQPSNLVHVLKTLVASLFLSLF